MQDILGLEWWVVLVVAVAVLLGALVQGVAGLGLGLLAAPVVTLVEPDVMPGLLLVLVVLLPVVTLAREHEEIDWSGLSWSLPPRVLGTALGVWLVATASDRVLAAGIGLAVLAAVVLTARTVEVPINRRSLSAAGVVSGVTGTVAAIGGPPLALLYQHRPPTQVRSTMAVYFMVGATLSLVGLGLGGELTLQEVALAGLLLPALVVGAVLAVPLRRRIAPAAFRRAMLVVCAASAVALLARAALGG